MSSCPAQVSRTVHLHGNWHTNPLAPFFRRQLKQISGVTWIARDCHLPGNSRSRFYTRDASVNKPLPASPHTRPPQVAGGRAQTQKEAIISVWGFQVQHQTRRALKSRFSGNETGEVVLQAASSVGCQEAGHPGGGWLQQRATWEASPPLQPGPECSQPGEASRDLAEQREQVCLSQTLGGL